MNPVIERLNKWGCDTSCIQSRFLEDEEFYMSLLVLVPEDMNFENLIKAANDGDASKMFECAHALKGMAANMGLAPIFEPASVISDLLRDGEMKDVSEPLAEIKSAREQLVNIITRE